MKDNIVKMLFLKAIYRVNAISIKILAALFLENDKFILKFMWKCEGLRISKAILRNKGKLINIL